MTAGPIGKGACAGLRVLDCSQGMAGPMAAMILADCGADVVKVEPPGGDWARRCRGFHVWNRNKRSIVADPGRDEALFAALLAWADVVVDPPVPVPEASAGTAAPLCCHISDWGPCPPTRPGVEYEGTLAAATGRMTGLDRLSGGHTTPGRHDPTFTLPPVGSYGAAQLAVQGILAALLAGPTGAAGRRVSTSLLQGSLAFLMRQVRPPSPDQELDVRDDAADPMHRGIELCFMTAECADGRFVQMCARQDHHFRAWLEALGLTAVLEEPRYAGAPMHIPTVADVDALESLLRSRMRRRSQAEWMRIFTTEHDIGCDPFLTPEEFLDHPQMVENGRVVELEDPVLGHCVQVGPLVEMSASPPPPPTPAPSLDQHHDEVLALAPGAPLAFTSPIPTADRHGAGPLSGVTVLEVAYFVAGPLAGAVLAELGARVIKVEPLSGDPYRRTGEQAVKFLCGKESIALDLKHPDARPVLGGLVRRADALVHSFRPGVPERLGLDEATVRARNPEIVYLNASSYGSRGPEAGRIAFHSTPAALSGAGILQGGRGNTPVDDAFPDPAAGLGAATALLLGLFARARFGIGQQLETTMLCSTATVMAHTLVRVDGRTESVPADPDQHGLHACYRLYRCRSGWLFLAAPRADDLRAVARVIGEPLADPGRAADPGARSALDDEVADRIGARLRQGDAASWSAAFREVGVAATVVEERTFDQWLRASGLLTPDQHPSLGTFWRPAPRVEVHPAAPRRSPPCAVGEHTEAILDELGYDKPEIQVLWRSGAVG